MALSANERVVRALARATAETLSRRAVKRLTQMRHTLSADDSELKTTWDEICAQVQGDERPFWEAYQAAIRDALICDVSELPEYTRQALWLQTPDGEHWDIHHGDDGEEPPVFEDDIIAYVTRHYVLEVAGRWSNRRIRAFMDRSMMSD